MSIAIEITKIINLKYKFSFLFVIRSYKDIQQAKNKLIISTKYRKFHIRLGNKIWYSLNPWIKFKADSIISVITASNIKSGAISFKLKLDSLLR